MIPCRSVALSPTRAAARSPPCRRESTTCSRDGSTPSAREETSPSPRPRPRIGRFWITPPIGEAGEIGRPLETWTLDFRCPFGDYCAERTSQTETGPGTASQVLFLLGLPAHRRRNH